MKKVKVNKNGVKKIIAAVAVLLAVAVLCYEISNFNCFGCVEVFVIDKQFQFFERENPARRCHDIPQQHNCKDVCRA